jgi:hypothetical protein
MAVPSGMLRRVALVRRTSSFSLLRERIHYTRRELDAVSKELLKLHLLLTSTLSAVDWDLFALGISSQRASVVSCS